jgi:hypothetical protein
MPSNVSEMRPPIAEDRSSPLGGQSGFNHFHNYAPWINVVLGFLVFVLRYDSPRGTHGVHWNLFLTGLVIMFAAFASTIAHDGNSLKNYWSAIDLAAGAWLLLSAKIVVSVLRVAIAQEILGALVIAVALISLAIEISQSRRERGRGN